MRDRRGALGRATEIAGSVVAGVKRRQQARAPKVLLYDGEGRPRTLDTASDPALALLETAQELVVLVGPVEPEADAPAAGGDSTPPGDERA
jgi:hypothetical protein